MTLRPQKRRRSSKNEVVCYVGGDRLSELPDDIILRILSFLPILDAVRTMLLRRFGNLWTFVRTLNLNIYEYLQMRIVRRLRYSRTNRFTIFVTNVLRHHKSHIIDNFRLCLDYSHYTYFGCYNNIQDELWFALRKQAKEIVLYGVRTRDPTYDQPPYCFRSQYLVKLEINTSRICYPLKVRFESLKELILDGVLMCEMAFQQLLSGCPSLQDLRIKDHFEMKKLSFNAPNIRKLSLVFSRDCDVSWYSCSLDFPNVETLELETVWIPKFIDISSLRNIYIKDFNIYMNGEIKLMKYKMLLEKLKGVAVLDLSGNTGGQFLHLLHASDLSQLRWKRMVLQWPVACKTCQLGIYDLLRNLTHLEELTIYSKLTGEKEREFVKNVSTFERASPSAKVLFA